MICSALGLGAACGRSSLEGEDDDAEIADGAVRPDARPVDGGPRDTGGGGCTSPADCDDGLFCNGVEQCIGGTCVASMPPSCLDMQPCTRDTCDESSDTCQFMPDSSLCAPGEICDLFAGCIRRGCSSPMECQDGFVCNGVEQCLGGTCVAGVPLACADPFACTREDCSEASGGCVSTPDDRACSDGRFCNGAEICDSMRGCVPGGGVRCSDGIACTADRCDEMVRACVFEPRDADFDGFPDAACGGSDCNDANPTVNPGAPEVCGDTLDNNCNGLVDCADMPCIGSPGCGTMCPDRELGSATGRVATGDTRGQRNDQNGSCGGGTAEDIVFGWTAPTAGTWVIDTVGSSYDTLIYVRSGSCTGFELACDDDAGGMLASRVVVTLMAGARIVIVVDGWGASSGAFALNITPSGVVSEVGRCTDGVDNDMDGRIDCADTDCAMDPACRCVPEICGNGLDDDCDLRVDCRDTDCCTTPACVMSPVCIPDAGVDSGTDAGPRDAGTDSGMCTARELGVTMCTDLADNDCDTRRDCADPDCSPFGPTWECCNGRDDDGDMLIDIFTCRCFSNAECAGVGSLEQVCWTRTFQVCAPRCDFYGGDAFCTTTLGTGWHCDRPTGECLR